MTSNFGARLRTALDTRAPLCVGIDPHESLLAKWGLPDTAAGVAQFTETVIDALADTVAVLKPQIAFYERFGSAGLAVLERTVPVARQAGTLVLLDAKRGDIGSTVTAYAQAYLDPASPLPVDALTASPYLGVGSLQPLFDLADQHGAGVFVLALTSNPEGAQVQHATTPEGTVADTILTDLAARNADATPMGSYGAVIGATVPKVDFDLTQLNGPILAPGLGAQGATAADLPKLFGAVMPNLVPMYGRSVLAAGPDRNALRDAAELAARECREAASAG